MSETSTYGLQSEFDIEKHKAHFIDYSGVRQALHVGQRIYKVCSARYGYRECHRERCV